MATHLWYLLSLIIFLYASRLLRGLLTLVYSALPAEQKPSRNPPGHEKHLFSFFCSKLRCQREKWTHKLIFTVSQWGLELYTESTRFLGGGWGLPQIFISLQDDTQKKGVLSNAEHHLGFSISLGNCSLVSNYVEFCSFQQITSVLQNPKVLLIIV